MNPLQAGGQLGQAIFGGKSSDDAYDQSFSQAAKAQGAMEEARRQRYLALIAESRVNARSSLPAALGGVYTDPAQAALGQAVLLSNDSVNLGDLGKLQAPGASAAYNQAATDMNLGDHVGYNEQESLAQGEQYQPTRIVGGVAIPDGAALGDSSFQMTPLPQTQATIDERHAGAAKEKAMAGAADALAEKRRAPAPNAAGDAGQPAGVSSPVPAAIKLPIGVEPQTVAFAKSQLTNGEPMANVKQALITHGHAATAKYLFGDDKALDSTDPSLNQPSAWAQNQYEAEKAAAAGADLGAQSVAPATGSVRGPALKRSAPAKVGASPYPEGTVGTFHGVRSIIKGGVPVPFNP